MPRSRSQSATQAVPDFPDAGDGLPPRHQARLRKASHEALDVLVGILKDPDQKASDRLKAADMVLERAWGRPRQAVDMALEAQVSLADLLARFEVDTTVTAVRDATPVVTLVPGPTGVPQMADVPGEAAE